MDSCLPPCPLFNPRLSQNIVDLEFPMWAICKTSSKSKAYPLELNILRRTDYPLLAIRPSRTGPHSKILDTRLPMWRKETPHVQFRSSFIVSFFRHTQTTMADPGTMHSLNLSYFSRIYTISPTFHHTCIHKRVHMSTGVLLPPSLATHPTSNVFG